LKFQELRYLLNMFHVIQNQLSLYTLAVPDVLSYSIHALSSITYVQPGLSASINVNYPQILDNLKTIM
jgi:coenzyme F420-reducing hydrogenase alpha subunit